MVARTLRTPGFHATGTRPITWKRSRLWQARLWVGADQGGEISLGLHPSEKAAHLFWREVRVLLKTRTEFDGDPIALATWECCRLVAEARGQTWDYLPKWVIEREENGETVYVAEGTIRGKRIETDTFPTPREAFEAFWETAGPRLGGRQKTMF